MQYTCKIVEDIVFAYLDGVLMGKFDTDTFLTSVISPLEFRQFERNSDKIKFNIRKLEFNNHNLKNAYKG
jgi:hypothetical protein